MDKSHAMSEALRQERPPLLNEQKVCVVDVDTGRNQLSDWLCSRDPYVLSALGFDVCQLNLTQLSW